MTTWTLKHIFSNEVISLTEDKLYEELNRDRSEEWSDYDQHSTLKQVLEGIQHFTEYEVIAVTV